MIRRKASGDAAATETDRMLVKTFVTETLGCRCPESVFEQIDCQEEAAVPGLDQPLKRLVIGDRLLIYILEFDDPAALQCLVPRLVSAARDERDRNGYNRVRAVIASEHAESLWPEAERWFSGLDEADEKVHLQVLPRCLGSDFF